MNKYKKFILLSLLLFLSSCGSLKEGFANQKKNSSDEFLVEKKSPLVMPPDFDELPIPKVNKVENATEENQIEKLIANKESENTNSKNIKETNESFENSILEKIKDN
jgi:hypothetical protein